MKKGAIVQSNYIPWKGYFDLIAAVDEFIILDDVQFTKNDWRNRNLIKTPKGCEWLSIPVGSNISRQIREVLLPKTNWKINHWKTLSANYARAPHFKEVSELIAPIYLTKDHSNLSDLNKELIVVVCSYLGIKTLINDSRSYSLSDGKSQRILDLVIQAKGTEYISGPTAQSYLELSAFVAGGVKITWFDYLGYPEYPQMWGSFTHNVTIFDLLFNCGRSAPAYMLYNRSA